MFEFISKLNIDAGRKLSYLLSYGITIVQKRRKDVGVSNDNCRELRILRNGSLGGRIGGGIGSTTPTFDGCFGERSFNDPQHDHRRKDHYINRYVKVETPFYG
ncbi:hypothetical protein TNCV_836361 [Trichonephila clavipes]|nr:hypothetical protein TNCV_836361 [Trichonephila clavipes]